MYYKNKRIFIFLALGLFLLISVSGCGLMNKDADIGAAKADAKENGENSRVSDPVAYKAAISIKDGPSFLKEKMKDLSQLVQLAGEKPDSMVALERRALKDKETALKLLHSQCYYDGTAELDINDKVTPVAVTLTLVPGAIFTVGSAKVVYSPKPLVPEDFKNRKRTAGIFGLEKIALPDPEFPDFVPNIEPGKPIIADDMLEKINAMPKALHKTGYPLAKIVSSIFTLDKPAHKLNALVTFDPGPPALLGKVIVEGEKEVSAEYLKKLVPWQPGKEPWDEELVDDYANRLRGLGLFRSVEVKPDEKAIANAANARRIINLPLKVSVMESPWRSLAATAKYDTDSGFGVEGIWENRNIFHNGEKLRIDAPISQQLYGIKSHFEKPAFLDRQQTLFADMSALRENTEAYKQESIKGELGIFRPLANNWQGAVSIFGEGGYLKDSENPKKTYGVISPRVNLHYDGRNSKLNPSRGVEMDYNLKPFSGFYETFFGALANTFSLAGYYAPLKTKNDGTINDNIVLAARAETGMMPFSSPLRNIPSSMRYYTGGAGSVRGYSYQSIGPRNKKGDPLGGRSYQVVNLESRFMVAKNIGIVPFIDGGMVYKEPYPGIIGNMDFGTGLGLRYYTPIGPVRLDVATPLHRYEGDPPVQFYVSIGQSF